MFRLFDKGQLSGCKCPSTQSGTAAMADHYSPASTFHSQAVLITSYHRPRIPARTSETTSAADNQRTHKRSYPIRHVASGASNIYLMLYSSAGVRGGWILRLVGSFSGIDGFEKKYSGLVCSLRVFNMASTYLAEMGCSISGFQWKRLLVYFFTMHALKQTLTL